MEANQFLETINKDELASHDGKEREGKVWIDEEEGAFLFYRCN